MEDGMVSLWWLLAAFFAGGYFTVFIMSLMNIASYESDRAEMSAIRGMPGSNARAGD